MVSERSSTSAEWSVPGMSLSPLRSAAQDSLSLQTSTNTQQDVLNLMDPTSLESAEQFLSISQSLFVPMGEHERLPITTSSLSAQGTQGISLALAGSPKPLVSVDIPSLSPTNPVSHDELASLVELADSILFSGRLEDIPMVSMPTLSSQLEQEESLLASMPLSTHPNQGRTSDSVSFPATMDAQGGSSPSVSHHRAHKYMVALKVAC